MSRNSKKSPQIHFMGGLGNQLFQFAYAHGLSNQFSEPYIFSIDHNARIDRAFDLEVLLRDCQHSSGNSSPSSISSPTIRTKIVRRAVNQLAKFNFLKHGVDSIAGIELNPFSSRRRDLLGKKWKNNIGYFQHWDLVEANWPFFGKELFNFLDHHVDVSQYQAEVSDSIILHVRRGDYVSAKNTMGLLSGDYYKLLLSKISNGHSKKILVFTDSKELINESFIREFEYQILGPDELSAWQTLKLISLGKEIVAANSTLSWWGGYLALQRDSGAKCYVPNPWFRDWHQRVENAFLHPKMTPVSSIFE